MKAKGKVTPPRAEAETIELDQGFWDAAEWTMPGEAPPKQIVSLRVEPWVVAFFRARGGRHTQRMAAVLKSFALAKQPRAAAKTAPKRLTK